MIEVRRQPNQGWALDFDQLLAVGGLRFARKHHDEAAGTRTIRGYSRKARCSTWRRRSTWRPQFSAESQNDLERLGWEAGRLSSQFSHRKVGQGLMAWPLLAVQDPLSGRCQGLRSSSRSRCSSRCDVTRNVTRENLFLAPSW